VAHQWLGRALDRAGRTGEAVEAQRRAVELLPGDPESIASLGHALARNGEVESAARKLAELERLAGERWVSSYWRGLVLMGLGRTDEAVRSLERAYDERFDWIVFIAIDPLFDPLRDVPEFRRLVNRIG
jgi:Flp pilus assembly protein TadD